MCYTHSWLVEPEEGAEPPDFGEIVTTAFHEVFEAQFYTIRPMLRELYSEDRVDHEIHRIVRRAENMLLPILREVPE